MEKLVVCLIGSTAVGKTAVSVELARRTNAEIISCDSMQVYRGMDVGTSKPSPEIRREIPHHLIDVMEPDKDYSVARFFEYVNKLLPEIISRGRLPLIVGGSGLYVRVLTQGLFPDLEADWGLRYRLEEEARSKGTGHLYKLLVKVDPKAAELIHPNNTRRIIRALEVYEKTKVPISTWQDETKGISEKYQLRIFGLIRKKEDLDYRINRRTEEMLKEGLIEETRALLDAGKLGTAASQALGYREVAGHLAGEYPLEKCEAFIKKNTHRFARRQMTWFRREKNVTWINIADNEPPSATAGRILGRLI